MPSPFGGDRVSSIGVAFLLTTARDKGWRPRTRATNTSSEFPGSAVEWEGVVYEVVAREESAGRVRYRLERWRDEHAIRHLDQYNAASEAARHAKTAEQDRRTRIGKWVEIGGVFTGLLPAQAQRLFSSRFGVSVTRITLMSTLPLMLFGIWCARYLPIPGLPYSPPPFPESLIPFGLFFLGESLVRLRGYLAGSPMGSIVGWIVYLPWLLAGGLKVIAALEEEDLRNASVAGLVKETHARETGRAPGELPIVDADAERKLHDAFIMREPFIALLDAREQLAMQHRFGFDPVSQGKRSVAFLMIVSLFGLGGAFYQITHAGAGFSRLISAALAMLLFIDQLQRMRPVAAGRPAPSILAPLARIVARKALEAPAVQPVFEGEGRNVVMPDVWSDDVEVRDDRHD